MYSVNDLIIYGSGSVCRVEAIATAEDLPGGDKERLYYTLRPLFDNGVIRVPVDAKVFMRPVVTKEEADALIQSIPTLKAAADFGTNSPQLLSEKYRSFFASHNCEDLLTLIKTVYLKAQKASAHGKSMGRTDQHFYQRAKMLIEQEFSVALGIPVPEVEAYIAQKIEQAE